MGFMIRPSEWEAMHRDAILAGIAEQRETGERPRSPVWDRLFIRWEDSPVRFARWHPNIALMFGECRNDRAAVVVPIEPPHDGGGTHPQFVPEPSSLVLWLLAIGAAWAWRAWR